MSSKICKLNIDGADYQFEVEGDFFWGKEELLYKANTNVISKMKWQSDGFGVVDAFENDEFEKLKQSIQNIIFNALIKHNVSVSPSNFKLEDYHNYVATNVLHNHIISITRNLEVKDFDFDVHLLVERFSEILGYKLTSWVEELQKTHIQIRISRPNSLDINPPHRDGYLSYWENIINVWIPIAGCNAKSSLPVLPKSHLLPEHHILRTQSKGAKINGNTYFVPCILETKEGHLSMIRPNPKEGQALLFSPFLIHGAAVNQNNDVTRISLELRFPKM